MICCYLSLKDLLPGLCSWPSAGLKTVSDYHTLHYPPLWICLFTFCPLISPQISFLCLLSYYFLLDYDLTIKEMFKCHTSVVRKQHLRSLHLYKTCSLIKWHLNTFNMLKDVSVRFNYAFIIYMYQLDTLFFFMRGIV